MTDADPQNGSPPDPSGSSSSAPVETNDVGAIGGKSVLVIKQALVYVSEEKMVDFPVDTIKAVNLRETRPRTVIDVVARSLHRPDLHRHD